MLRPRTHAHGFGSLLPVARFALWFSLFYGSLTLLVLLLRWLAFNHGSLCFLARLFFWFSPFAGSLLPLVLYKVWLALVRGSLVGMARYLLGGFAGAVRRV